MSLDLLGRRRFAPFFWTQFFGAFNDNVFKNAVILRIAFSESTSDAQTLINLSAGLFVLPFLLFSGIAGQLADKNEKSSLIRATKLAEIVIMLIGGVGFFLGSLPLLLTVLFLMGAQSAFFGPVKYSILPQHLKVEELVGGNGLVEMGTFVAILIGTICGGLLIGVANIGTTLVSAAVAVVAILGYFASRAIPKAEAADPQLRIDWNLAAESLRNVGMAMKIRAVWLSILGISWFWFYGAFFLAQFPTYAAESLGGDETIVTVLLAAFSLGIGIGSLLCERISGPRLELGLVPVGAFGLTAFAIALYFFSPSSPSPTLLWTDFFTWSRYAAVFASLVSIGVFAGFYGVPLYTLMQERSEPSTRSRVIAANNIINALFMVASAGVAIGLAKLGLDAKAMLLATGVFNLFVAIYIFTLLPEFMLRFVSWMVVRVMYRLRTEGLEHIPTTGPALLVCNHVSFVDAIVLAAVVRRPMRFVMYYKIFQVPLLKLIFRGSKAIPIAGKHEDEAMMEKAFVRIAEELREGELVCIFPEGKLTQTGEMNPFKTGVERILAETPVSVVPMALQGLWGSFFSRKGGPAMTRPFRRFRSELGVVVAAPMESTVTAAQLEKVVAKLRGDNA